MPTLLEIIKADSAYLKDITVEIKRAWETVEITDDTGVQEPIFLQGQDAYEFINKANGLSEESSDANFADIERHCAKVYVDCIWS